MAYAKHFSDSNWLVKNNGYVNLENQINDFLKKTTITKIIDLKYTSVFNPNLNDIHGNRGVIQFSALLIYEV